MQVPIFLVIIILILGGLLLSRSAILSVRTLQRLSISLHLSYFIVSFLIMSVATSLPELFVGIISSLKGESNFALGTVIGSNIINFTLVAGLVSVIAKKLGIKNIFEKKHGYYALATTFVLLLFLLDGYISRLEGGALILVYILYILYISNIKNVFASKQKQEKIKSSHKNNLLSFLKNVVLFLISVGGLVIGAEVVFRSSFLISSYFHFPKIVMALVFVSLSTSLPELVFEIVALKKGKNSMVLGDLLGSISTNSGVIVGICSLINPITVLQASVPFKTSIVFLVASAFLFVFFIRTDRSINWKEGIVLLLVYFVYTAVQYLEGFYSGL